MIKLIIISNSMPYQVGIIFGGWTKVSGGLNPRYAGMIKFGTYYGRLEASRSYAEAWEAMTTKARLGVLQDLVPTRWDVSPEQEVNSFKRAVDRLFKSPDTIGDPTPKAPVPAPRPAASPAPAPAEKWDCKCGATALTGKFCPKCGTKKPDPKPAPPKWNCDCGTANEADSAYCTNCGKERPKPAPAPEKTISEMTPSELVAVFMAAAKAAEAAEEQERVANAPKAPKDPIDVTPEDVKPVDQQPQTPQQPADPPTGAAGN